MEAQAEYKMHERAQATAKAIRDDGWEPIAEVIMVDLRYAYSLGYQAGKHEATRRD